MKLFLIFAIFLSAAPGAAIAQQEISSISTAAFFKEINLAGLRSNAVVCAEDIRADIRGDIRAAGKCAAGIVQLNGRAGAFTVALTVKLDAVLDGPLGSAANARRINDTVRGEWTMAVTRADCYVGTLFGDLLDGKTRLTFDILSGTMTGRSATGGFRILGGSDGYSLVEPNDVPTLNFSSFTKIPDGLGYTEGRLEKIF